MKRNEDILTDLQDNIKCTNICIIGIPEGEKREKGLENISEEVIAENFPNTGKEIVKHIQEAQKSARQDKPKEDTLRYIIIELTKIKNKDKLLKATREKRQITYKRQPIRLSADFSTETLQTRREGHDIFQVMKGKNLRTIQQDSHSDLMEKSKAFQTSKS